MNPAQGELRDAGPLAHQRKETEDQRARRLTDHHDHDRLDETQAKLWPDRSVHPRKRRDVGAEPDPELLPGGRIAVAIRCRLDPVLIDR